MASEDLIDVKLEAFEMRIENKLCAPFTEFRLGRSLSPTRSQQGGSLDCKENPPKKEEHMKDPVSTRIRVDFPRWEDGDPTRWLSYVEGYFQYHRTLEASMVDIAAIHLKGDAIQWYNWFEHT
ncbi:hypothetical protein GW17_00056746 [Ensete ventricosum]|nr:hypothetical protein GW17_00056746 [Ensete ventricosum]